MERPNRTYPHESSSPRAAVTGLTERQKTILDALTREYVATAEPVASSELVQKYRLPYSPATVRGELLALDETGYLTQPHTSAGRIPTDKGYRFYINRLEGGDGLARGEEAAIRELRELDDPFEFMRQTSRLLAHLSRSFALAGFPEEVRFYKFGIREVMQEPEFADLRFMQEFSVLMDMVEDELTRRFDPEEFMEPRVFIGHENPIREARHYGMIVFSLATPFEKENIIALIGPKRMDYAHNLSILRHFRELLTA